jgi:hypothetical protein
MILFKLIGNITIVRNNLIDIIEICGFLLSNARSKVLDVSETPENKKRYFSYEPSHDTARYRDNGLL